MRKPLEGCRVIDFGIITAGAATSALLADLGADVIKVESPTYRDPFRAWVGGLSLAGGADCPAFFRSNNRGKRGISIDLKQPAGRDAVLRLVAKSDVVLENFRRGVLARLGLDVAALRGANPELIVLSISGQGGVGPDAGQVSYGSTLEAVGGLAWLTGYAGGPPVVSGRELNYPDQVVALFAAGAVLAAWLGRKPGGAGGAVIDVSQRELTSYLVGEAFLAAEAAGARGGNAAPEYALQGCYQSGDGSWVALSVAPAEVAALARLLGAAEASLEAPLAAWLGAADAADRVALLKEAGIAAAVVQSGTDLATAAVPAWDHAFGTTPEGGLIKAMPFGIDGLPFAVLRDAPAVGQHTHEVLAELAGYDDSTLQTLAASGVIESPHT
jgi:formyl-CoA transferase